MNKDKTRSPKHSYDDYFIIFFPLRRPSLLSLPSRNRFQGNLKNKIFLRNSNVHTYNEYENSS